MLNSIPDSCFVLLKYFCHLKYHRFVKASLMTSFFYPQFNSQNKLLVAVAGSCLSSSQCFRVQINCLFSYCDPIWTLNFNYYICWYLDQCSVALKRHMTKETPIKKTFNLGLLIISEV